MTGERLPTPSELRRRLHMAPEIALCECETARVIAEHLAALGADAVLEGVGGTGVVALFGGDAVGPTVALRAELDALPLVETGDVPYRSAVAGRGHLCGHDGHMATLAGVAADLTRRRPERGRVALLFQPAEETGEGARRVVDDPRWRDLGVEWAFAWHNLPGHPLGRVVVRDGAFACGSVGLELRLAGVTSHAAHPELGRSPAEATARLIQGLSALADGVATEGGIRLSTVVHARLGTEAFGTTPGEAVVCATLRADTEAGLTELRTSAEALARSEAELAGLGLELAWREPFPVTVPHPRANEIVRDAAATCGLGVEKLREPLRWSEDFGWITADCRGTLFGLGAGEAHPPLHAPDYDFPDALLEPAARLLRALVDRVLRESSVQEAE